MKKLIPLITAICLVGCASPKKEASTSTVDFVGTYVAEHVVDTVEELSLQPDGSFTFHFLLLGDKDSWYAGRWDIRSVGIVLVAKDEAGKEVEFPLAVDRTGRELALVYSHESYSQAKATMLLPNSFRRVSKTPNQIPEPTPNGVAHR